MNPIYYCIALDDPASPSFCRFAKNYFGTVFAIDHVMDRMAESERCPDTVQAFIAVKDDNMDRTVRSSLSKQSM